jgi:hypothetical protein
MTAERRYRAGETIEDVCRACKVDRLHTVVVVDGDGRPLRVTCDYCHSEHNYRGGPATARASASAPALPHPPERRPPGDALPLVSDRERVARPVSIGAIPARRPDAGAAVGDGHLKADAEIRPTGGALAQRAWNEPAQAAAHMTNDTTDLELLLRRIIREEAGVTPVVPAAKWRGGTLVLRPAQAGLQEKTWPIDTLFHKIVMIRNRLRTLEQQVNASDLPDDVKLKLQAYVSGCYGSLTSFNLLFADEDDQFKGSSGD